MSAVNRSESTAGPFGQTGPTASAEAGIPTGQGVSGLGTAVFTAILSGVTVAGIGGHANPAVNASGNLANQAGWLQMNATNYISGGRIIVPFWYQVSGVP